jgi:transposase
MNKKYIVRLTAEERRELENLVKKGKTQAYRIKHANILLAVDADGPNWPDHQIAKAYKCHQNTVVNVRQRFVEQGFHAALERKKQQAPSRKRVIDGESEARLISIACSKPPEGCAKWTMQMLASKLVTLKVVDSVSGQTVWRTLKKTNLSLT